jgi:hypothetical protein
VGQICATRHHAVGPPPRASSPWDPWHLDPWRKEGELAGATREGGKREWRASTREGRAAQCLA